MTIRLLIAYASRTGSTVQVARWVGEGLADPDTPVVISPLREVKNLTAYQGIVIGSAIRNGAWLQEAVDFLRLNQRVLRRAPVALFSVCMTMMSETIEARCKAAEFTEPLLQIVQPVGLGLFAGQMDYSKLSMMERVALQLKRIPQGDFRRREEAVRWAQSVKPLLLNQLPLQDAFPSA